MAAGVLVRIRWAILARTVRRWRALRKDLLALATSSAVAAHHVSMRKFGTECVAIACRALTILPRRAIF